MKVKELIEKLKNVDENFDHDFETVYLVAEYL